MDRATFQRCLVWTGPHQNIHYYGRARTGPAPRHSLLWAGPQRARITMGGPAPGPRRARSGLSLLWAGPHRDTHYYGRARSGPAFLWAAATPFGPYKVISKRCEEDGLLHNAKLLSSIFTNQITLYLSPAPKRCKCSDDARHLPQTRYACNLDGAHFQFPCAWRACPHMLKANPGLEPLILWHGHLPRVWRAKWYPFFLTQMPCIRVPSLCVRVPVASMCCDVLHHSCTQWQAAIYFNNNIRNLQNSFNDDLSLRALATSLGAFLLPIFRWPCSKVCAMSAHILGGKLAPKYGTTNFAPDTQFSFRDPFLGLIVGSVLGSAKSYKKASRNPQSWQRRVEVYGTTQFHLPAAGYRNFLLCIS